MPSYITHAIFGQDLHQGFIKENNNKIIDKKYMIQYALGPDLSRFTNSYKATHRRNTQEFLMAMIWYIKNNKLENDACTLGILFGHISHYFLDINIHPLIYYNALGCETIGMVSPHTFIESYLDEYFKRKKELSNVRLLKDFEVNEDKCQIIVETYNSVYKEKKILSSIKKSLMILDKLELLSMKLPKELLIKLTRFDDFLDFNLLSKDEILNSYHGEWLNPMTGKINFKSIDEMYIDAFNQALESMIVVINYFDNKVDIKTIENLFKDLSYNTGVNCSLGQDIKYIRKKIK